MDIIRIGYFVIKGQKLRNFLKKENKVFENKIDADEQKSQQKVIDTSGI